MTKQPSATRHSHSRRTPSPLQALLPLPRHSREELDRTSCRRSFWRRHLPRMRSAAIISLIFLPVILVGWATVQGPGITQDSSSYAYAAQTFAERGTLSSITGGALTIFPPGFPLILGTTHAIGMSIDAADRSLDLLALSITLVLVYLVALEALRSASYGLMATAIVALNRGTFDVFRMLWSEPIFVALTLATLYLILRSIRHQILPWKIVAAIAGLASLATTVRYIGILFLPVVFAGAMTICRRDSIRVAVVTGGSGVGFVLIGLRNLLHGTAIMGPRVSSSENLMSALNNSGSAIAQWLLVGHLSQYYPTVSLSEVIIVVVGIAIGIARRDRIVLVLGGFTVLYWVALLYSEVSTPIDAVDTRLTIPVIAPMAILAAYTLMTMASIRPSWRISRLAAIGVVAAVSISVVSSIAAAKSERSTGIGFNKPVLMHSEFARLVRALPRRVTVASNDPAALSWLSGRGQILQIPAPSMYSPAAVTQADLATLERAVASGPVELAYASVPNTVSALWPASLPISCGQPLRYDIGVLYTCRPLNLGEALKN